MSTPADRRAFTISAPRRLDLPYVSSTTLNGGNLGFPYASFLLGQVDSATVSNLQDPQIRKIGLGFYAQDTWKVTHKLTLDYGLRYDYETVWQEIHGRFSSFEPGRRESVGRGIVRRNRLSRHLQMQFLAAL